MALNGFGVYYYLICIVSSDLAVSEVKFKLLGGNWVEEEFYCVLEFFWWFLVCLVFWVDFVSMS
jgi:hypothetical protein